MLYLRIAEESAIPDALAMPLAVIEDLAFPWCGPRPDLRNTWRCVSWIAFQVKLTGVRLLYNDRVEMRFLKP